MMAPSCPPSGNKMSWIVKEEVGSEELMKINLMNFLILPSSGMLIYETGLTLFASQTVNAPNIWESTIDDCL